MADAFFECRDYKPLTEEQREEFRVKMEKSWDNFLYLMNVLNNMSLHFPEDADYTEITRTAIETAMASILIKEFKQIGMFALVTVCTKYLEGVYEHWNNFKRYMWAADYQLDLYFFYLSVLQNDDELRNAAT